MRLTGGFSSETREFWNGGERGILLNWGPERLEWDEADRWVPVWDSRILERNEGEGRGV